MKILFLNPSGQLGGAERVLLDFMASIRATHPAWHLEMVATAEGPFVSRAVALGIATTVLPLPAPLAAFGDGGVDTERNRVWRSLILLAVFVRGAAPTAAYIWRLRRHLRLAAPDVIHSNGFKTHLLGLWARPPGVPVIWHVHDFVARRPLMSTLLRRHARRCAAVVANSRSVAEDVRAVCGESIPIHLLYNAVDLETFSPDGPMLDLDAAARLSPPPPGTVRIGLIATLAWWKGHTVFLQALSLLPPELPFRAYVVGGALYETQRSQHTVNGLRELTVKLGIEDRVGFTGFVEDAAAAMRALDIVVHASSEPEPFGLVIAEAMACGRPLVVSLAGGAAELVRVGENALGHRPGDSASLAQCIRVLINDPSLRRALGQAGRVTAERSFDRARLAGQLVPIYRAAGAFG